jgi:hypothetical protein
MNPVVGLWEATGVLSKAKERIAGGATTHDVATLADAQEQIRMLLQPLLRHAEKQKTAGRRLDGRGRGMQMWLSVHSRVRRNYPYAGKGDGLTSHLRLPFPPRAYVGIELEVNQSLVLAAGRRWTMLRSVLIDSLRMAWSA